MTALFFASVLIVAGLYLAGRLHPATTARPDRPRCLACGRILHWRGTCTWPGCGRGRR